MTLSMMPASLMTLSIKSLFATIRTKDTQPNNTAYIPSVIMLSVITLSVFMLSAISFIVMLSVILLNVVA
jgi:hypothetical protein